MSCNWSPPRSKPRHVHFVNQLCDVPGAAAHLNKAGATTSPQHLSCAVWQRAGHPSPDAHQCFPPSKTRLIFVLYVLRGIRDASKIHGLQQGNKIAYSTDMCFCVRSLVVPALNASTARSLYIGYRISAIYHLISINMITPVRDQTEKRSDATRWSNKQGSR